jgi:SP family facilitated glucose transporter-like MFS transporter 1
MYFQLQTNNYICLANQVGVAGMIVCAILITIAQNVNKDGCQADSSISANGVGVFLVVSTLAFVVFFALGPGSIPWLITGEVFAHGSRPAAIAIAVFVNW